MKRHLAKTTFALAAVTLLGACTEDNPAFDPDPLPAGETCLDGRQTVQEVAAFEDPGAIDILLVVSNAPGTGPIQQRLATAMPRFVSLLDAHGLDYQIGVTHGDTRSPDATGALRAGGQDNPDCDDAPRLITPGANAGRFAACNVLQGEAGNTAQELGEAAVAALTVRATEPQDNGGNAGFLRPRARLMVFFVTDRDDCSNDGVDLTRFGANNAVTSCALAGDELTPVDELAQALVSLKPSLSAVSVAVIGGSDDGRDLAQGENQQPTCADAEGNSVFPTTRLIALTELFGERSVFESACAASYGVSAAHVTDLAAPGDLVVCAEAIVTGTQVSVELGSDDLEQGVDGFVYLGRTEACDNGAFQISSERLIGSDDSLALRYCGR